MEVDKWNVISSILQDGVQNELLELTTVRADEAQLLIDLEHLATELEAIIGNNVNEIDLMVSIGTGLKCDAKVNNTKTVFVQTGCHAFFVELPLAKSIEFIRRRGIIVKKKIDILDRRIVDVNTKTKLALEEINLMTQRLNDLDPFINGADKKTTWH